MHGFLDIPWNIDMIIHAGDGSNTRDPGMNANEILNFMDWYDAQSAKYKIYIPGNHDTSMQAGLVRNSIPESITVLIHEHITIEGIKIFGSPYTPEFGHGWAYNVSRARLDPYWQDIPEDTDILVTHGPPRTILDLTSQGPGHYFQCGCGALLNRVLTIQPRYHVFGHIHSESTCINGGTYKNPGIDTVFINASVVDKEHKFTNNGIIINL